MKFIETRGRPRQEGSQEGTNILIRANIRKVKTGSCQVCRINLYGKKREQKPAASTLPCHIENCPY